MLLLVGGSAYALSQSQQFTAESVVVVLPSATLDDATSAAYYETLSRGQIVATFAEVAGNLRFEQQAEDRLALTADEREAVSTAVTVVPDTAVILIRSTAPTAEMAEQMAAQVTELSSDYWAGLSKPYRTQAVGTPKGSAYSSGSSPLILLAAAVGVAAVAGVATQQAVYHLGLAARAGRRSTAAGPDRGGRRRGGAGRLAVPLFRSPARRAHEGRHVLMADTPLRILVVEFLPSGGMFQFSFQFADALAAEGHQVQLLTGPDPELSSANPRLEVLAVLPTWHPNAQVGGPTWLRRPRRAFRAFQLLDSWRRVVAHVIRDPP